jgi:transposase
MGLTTICKKLFEVTSLVATGMVLTPEGLVFLVKPRWRIPRCGCCGRRGPGYDQAPPRRWQHLPVGSVRIWIEYAPRRVHCPECGIRIEQVPWAPHASRFTTPMQEYTAYLAQITDKTAVTKLLGIAWETVGSIVERVVATRQSEERFEGLRNLGVDEFSYRKRHRYITVVIDHEQQRVIWAGKGKSAQTLAEFFNHLGEQRLEPIEQVSIDMSGGYIKAITEHLPQAKIVFDRFHVQRLASDALNKVRRAQVRAADDPEEAKAVKNSRYALLKNPWNLTDMDAQKLSEIQRTNQPLYRAYLLKESLAKALDYLQPKRARDALDAWLSWASRSRLKPFVKLARTIRQYKDGILAYIKDRATNARVEGINNRLRMVARRAFGFHSAEALISMLFLCCGGIQLNPPLPHPQKL